MYHNYEVHRIFSLLPTPYSLLPTPAQPIMKVPHPIDNCYL
ncbi:hypothetical protein [Moorena producens]|nr:hypothetical protein [Moorena producens]